MAKFTILGGDFPMAVHVAGCADLNRGKNSRTDRYTVEAVNIEAAMQTELNIFNGDREGESRPYAMAEIFYAVACTKKETR